MEAHKEEPPNQAPFFPKLNPSLTQGPILRPDRVQAETTTQWKVSPDSPLNLPFNVINMYGVLHKQVPSQKYKIPFNDISGTSSYLNPPQYSIITNTSRS